jgi:serine/threonine protein kinase
MATQLLIKRGSKALSDTRVEFDDAVETRTDANGLVHLELEPGPHRLRIEVDGNELEVPFRLDSGGELRVLDIDELLEEAMRETAGLPDDVPVEVAERYRVQNVLGRGGMGIVVRAWDSLLERQVAIKFLNEQMAAHEEAQDIFLKEARSLARLRHDCLVDVHDVSVDNGQPIMVTEFVQGDNLASVLTERGQLDADTILSLTESVCEGLAHMHSHGLIHRDIKPANIILQPDGHLKLIDFGLARSLEHLVSQGTQVRGTPAYMAPEQVKGEELGPATDIYQLGVTLFELATATIPFPDDPYGLAHVEESVPTLESRGIDPDPRLESLIEACLCKDPDARPADASVILDYLQSASETEPAGATPTTSGLGPSVPPWAITATSTVAVVGLAALAWIYIGSDDDPPADRDALRNAAPPVRPTDPPPKEPPALDDALADANGRIVDALNVAAGAAERAGPAKDDETVDTETSADREPPSDESRSGVSASGESPSAPATPEAGGEDSPTGSPQRSRGSGPTAKDDPSPSAEFDQPPSPEPDAGTGLEGASETKPESSASDKGGDGEKSHSDGAADTGTSQPMPADPKPSERPSDDEPSGEPKEDSSEDDSSEEKEPPNPRFF